MLKFIRGIINWFKAWYWNVRYDLPRDRQRTFREGLKWVFLWPWYSILRRLTLMGFLNPPEGSYMRLRDFTPFFWNTLTERAVLRERKYWKREMSLQHASNVQLLETARREAQEEVWEYLQNKIDADFGRREIAE